MVRRPIWSVVVLLLVVPAPASGDWLQEGGDAARTSFTPEDGPMWPDVAFQLRLPADGPSEFAQPEPIVVGSTIFVAGTQDEGALLGLEMPVGVVYAADIATGQVRRFARLDIQDDAGNAMGGKAVALASDGVHVFILDRGELHALKMDGSPAWPPVRINPVPHAQSLYLGGRDCNSGFLALHLGDVFVTCETSDDSPSRAGLLVLRVEGATGDIKWRWDSDVDAAGRTPYVDESDPSQNGVVGHGNSLAGDVYLPTGISIVGDEVVVAVRKDLYAYFIAGGTAEVPNRPLPQALYIGLSVDGNGERGKFKWQEVGAYTTFAAITPSAHLPNWAPPATGTGNQIFLELSKVLVRPTNSTAPSTHGVPIRGTMQQENDAASGFALAPEGLYATSSAGIHLLETDLALVESWHLEPGDQWGRGAPVRTGNGIVIARFGSQTYESWLAPYGSLQALESRTLVPLWTVAGAVNCTFAVSDGLVVRWCADGVLQVLGTNEASIQIAVDVSSIYPPLGATVRVDLRKTGPGGFGPASEFRAVWGDGSETEWQADPVFEHRFTLPEDAHARFYARNENQTSSQAVLFHVGQRDPAVNILNSPFSAQYQETSFFFLGLIVTAMVAALGIARAGRKRRHLHRELRDLEADYDRLQSDAPACDHMLTQRKARARALFLQRRLEEAHSSFLTGRIDELRRNLRLGAVDTRLKFLPYGMVLQLQRLLADARIDEYERDHFAAALEHETSLTEGQKSDVARVIDSWFARDVEARQ